MRLAVVLRTLGALLLIYSVAVVPAMGVSLWYRDGELTHMAQSFGLTLVAGLALWGAFRGRELNLRRRDGFVVVTMLWVVLGAVFSIPFVTGLHLSVSDAVFESVSAFTTTGATVIPHLDQLPPSILFWRQELQWLGGIGVIVAAIAILPLLGIGGMQLYQAETPGPMKEEKMTPRIRGTARALWSIYVGITVACILGYMLAGMPLFDAVAHSMATVSTGGFSIHDASLGYYDSPWVEIVAEVFMLMGGINFSMHYLAITRGQPVIYWQNPEVRVFLLVVLGLIAVVASTLVLTHALPDLPGAIRVSSFQVISVITSTGFATADFSVWPLFLPVLLIFSSFMGGCGGSTAGGIKVMRFMVLAKQGLRDIGILLHPHGVSVLRVGGRKVPPRVVQGVWGFFAAYLLIFVLMDLVLMADGMDTVTAFGAVATCLNNLGPGLGEVSTSFSGVSHEAQWVLVGAMLMGRLEIFTIMVLLSPAFWRD